MSFFLKNTKHGLRYVKIKSFKATSLNSWDSFTVLRRLGLLCKSGMSYTPDFVFREDYLLEHVKTSNSD